MAAGEEIKEVTVNLNLDNTSVMELDVSVGIGGIHTSLTEANIVTYDEMLRISDYSPESTNERRYASSAYTAKKLRGFISEIEGRLNRIESGNSGSSEGSDAIDATRIAGYILTGEKIKIEVFKGADDIYFRTVKIPKETCFICGDQRFYLSEEGYCVNNTTASYFYCLVDKYKRTFRLATWNDPWGEDEYLFFAFNKDSMLTTLDPFAYTINGTSNILNLQKGVKGSSIFDSNGYSEFLQKFNQSSRGTTISSTSKGSRLVLCHFSDIHGDGENYRRLIEFTDEFRSYIDDVICTGDMIRDVVSDDFSFWNDSRILTVIGNHDTAIRSNGVYDWTGYGKVNAYNRYFKPFIKTWNVTQPANAESNGLMYYYKDYSSEGIRLIALDCMFWDSTQKTWLVNTLADAKSKGLAVIAAVHYPKDMNRLKCPFCSYSNDTTEYLGQEPIDAVQNFIDGGGEFIVWLTGHTHIDFMGVVKNTSQLMIAIENSQRDDAWNDSNRVAGTKSQDSFNILSVDKNDKTLTIFRVGNNMNKWLQKKDVFCINYAKKEIMQ